MPVCMLSCFSYVQLCVTPWAVACQYAYMGVNPKLSLNFIESTSAPKAKNQPF